MYRGVSSKGFAKVDHEKVFEEIDMLVRSMEGNPPLDVSFAYKHFE